MKLLYYCKSCKKENYLKVKSTNRFALKEELGKTEINERCKHCGNHTKRHINRLFATPNKLMIIGSISLSILVAIVFWNLGFITKLVFMIPIWIGFDEQKKASKFNKVMIED